MRLPSLIAACLLLAACSASPPPGDAHPAAPAAAASATAPADKHTELRDAMQAPIDKAKSADAIQQQGVEDEKKAIDDAGG